MSAATDRFYVHWLEGDTETDKELKQSYANYFLAKTELKNKVAFNTYSLAIKNQFQGNEEEAARYLRTISDVVKDDGGAFQTVLNQAFNEFSVLSTEAQSTKKIAELARELSNDITALDGIISQYKEIIKFLGENIDVTALFGGTVMNPVLNDQARKLFNIKDNPTPLITKEEYKAFGGYYRAIYVSLINKVNEFSAKVSSLDGSGLSKVNPDELATMLFAIANSIRPIAGIMSEYVIENTANSLLTDFEKGIKISKASERVSIAEKQWSEKTGMTVQTFTKKTKDLEININGLSATANFNFDQGGITLKRTTTNKAESLIHLKGSSTRLANYIREAPDLNLEAFYNVYANNKFFDSAVTGNMYNTIHGIIIAKALAGSLTQNDISVIMVINNKPFTIFDLLNAEGDYSKYVEYIIKPELPALAGAIAAIHKKIQISGESSIQQARKRSNHIIGAINKQNIGVMLKLKGLI